MIGRQLARYRIVDRLGAGGMGIVYRAHDPRLHRDVAIKVLPPALASDPQARQRFLHEARAVAALDHPNVCAIYEVDETKDGEVFLVMPLYAGETLDRRAYAGGAPVTHSVAIALQVAEGLAMAHARGIVHRDIKPSNVLLTPDGGVRILDFGLARIQDATRLTATSASLGTPAYMSPEQVRGETLDARSDVWSCGILLYALLAGRSPFEADSTHAVMFAILNRPPEPIERQRPDVPALLAELIARCLSTDPMARPAHGAELASALRAVLATLDPDSDATVTMARLSEPTRSRARSSAPRPARTWRVPAWASVAVALGVIAVAGVSLRDRLFPREPLRLAVLPARIDSPADSVARADLATSLQTLAIRGLVDLSGISVIDPAELRGLDGPPDQIARAVSADEVIVPSLDERGDEWRVRLSRLDGRTGTVRGTNEFAVPRDELMPLADALAARLAAEYREHRPRLARTANRVAAADFDEWMTLRRAYLARDGGGLSSEALGERIEALRRRSPRFLEIHLLEADHALRTFLTTRDAERLTGATEAIGRAEAIAPQDPRVHVAGMRAALEANRLSEAERHLATLRRVAPGDASVALGEAQLAEKRGDHDVALASLDRLVKRRPSRTHLTRLADLEYRIGRYDAARTHLDTLLARFPSDRYPLSKLAELELLYGRPSRAETLYAALIERSPTASMYWSNRGLSRMLLGRAGPAAEDFRAADARDAGSPAVRLNLADAELLLGQRDLAHERYAGVLRGLEADTTGDAGTLMLRAQCLARLGRMREAVGTTQQALRTAGEDSEVHYLASLVYALAGEPSSAIVHADRARSLGVGARWFTFPWFDGIRDSLDASPAASVAGVSR